MRIHFFEEFPTKRNLAKLKYVTWPCTLYVAAESIAKFEQIAATITKKNISVVYWPILKKEEGYWLSPFSSPTAVERVINECQGKNVMWDAELPLRSPWMFLRVDHYIRNMWKIKTFFRKNGNKISTSEYTIKNSVAQLLFHILGISFSPKKYNNTKIVMYYTSMHTQTKPFLLHNIEQLYQKHGKKLHVGLGTIARGILGDEPILSPSQLRKDLQDMKQIGVRDVVVFRLGGLNEKYIGVLKEITRKA